MKFILSLTALIFSASFVSSALALPGGDVPGKAPGDKMHQLKPGMLRVPTPAPWVKVQLDAVWLQDSQSHQTQPNAAGILTGPQACPVSLSYRATITSTVPNPTVALMLSDGSTVAAVLPPAGTPSGGFYTFVFGGSADVTKTDANAHPVGLVEPLSTVQAHVQILTPKSVAPTSITSTQTVTMAGAQCTNVVCSIQGCGYSK